jgi:hypothetical protein
MEGFRKRTEKDKEASRAWKRNRIRERCAEGHNWFADQGKPWDKCRRCECFRSEIDALGP